MSQATVQYKRTLKGSIGAGMKSLAGGERRFYVLEHKVSTKYHKAGEQQTIIVDQIELGRDPKCQVRFDESFSTVSRRHAAIVKDGDNWKLVQLSQTNTTFLNGRPVQKEWYLQNGDEIQLSTNGPKLGFNVPAGEKGMVKSLRLTTRLNLFREQALRPYKRAMAVMAAVFLICISALGAWNYQLHVDLRQQSARLVEQIQAAKGDKARLDSLTKELVKANQSIADQQKKLKKIARSSGGRSVGTLSGHSDISKLFEDVYYVEAYLVYNNTEVAGWSGTGFLLSNGDFVTAQHMIHFTGISDDSDVFMNALYNMGMAEIYMTCTSNTNEFTIKYTYDNNPFRMGPARCKEESITSEDGTTWMVRHSYNYGSADWAVLHTNHKGKLNYNASLSRELPIQTTLHILGFPAGQKITTKGSVNPIYSTAVTARQGLEDDGTIKTANDNTDHGNSGGPVLIEKNGQYTVVGILSGANVGQSSSKGRVVPIGAAY